MCIGILYTHGVSLHKKHFWLYPKLDVKKIFTWPEKKFRCNEYHSNISIS